MMRLFQLNESGFLQRQVGTREAQPVQGRCAFLLVLLKRRRCPTTRRGSRIVSYLTPSPKRVLVRLP